MRLIFTWVIRRDGRVVLSTPDSPRKWRSSAERQIPALPVETLAELGIAPETVTDVVLTHLHYDHVGNFHKFPSRPLPLAGTRDGLRHRRLTCATRNSATASKVEDVVGMVKLNFKGRGRAA